MTNGSSKSEAIKQYRRINDAIKTELLKNKLQASRVTKENGDRASLEGGGCTFTPASHRGYGSRSLADLASFSISDLDFLSKPRDLETGPNQDASVLAQPESYSILPEDKGTQGTEVGDEFFRGAAMCIAPYDGVIF
jgi:hypothetical protein